MAASISVFDSAPASLQCHVAQIKQYHAAIRGWLSSALGSRKRTLGIVVLGESGVGKSSLVNGLLGKEVAIVGKKLDSATSKLEKYELLVSGINVTVWDTPGFGIEEEDVDVATMRQIKAQCKIDLFLFCVKMSDTRWPMRHDKFTVEMMAEVFGKKIWQYCQFVLTFANKVENDLGAFKETISLFEGKLVDALTTKGSMAPGQKVNIVPTGDPRIRPDNTLELPGIKDWFDNFWFECCSNIRQSALPTLIKVNMHRMHDVPDDIVSADEAEDTTFSSIGDSHVPVVNARDEDSSIDRTIESHDQDVNFSDEIGFDSCTSIVSDQPSPPAARTHPKKSSQNPLGHEHTQTKAPQGARSPRPNSPNQKGLETHPISFYRTMQHMLEKKDSGFSEYVTTYAEGRGKKVIVLGHSYGFFEGLVSYIHSKTIGWWYGTPEKKDEEKDKDKNKEKDKIKDKEKDKIKDKEKDKIKDKEKDKIKDKEKDKIKDKEKDKIKDKEKDKIKDKEKDKIKDKEKDKIKDKEKDKIKDKEKDKIKDKEKDKIKDKEKDKIKDKEKDKDV